MNLTPKAREGKAEMNEWPHQTEKLLISKEAERTQAADQMGGDTWKQQRRQRVTSSKTEISGPAPHQTANQKVPSPDRQTRAVGRCSQSRRAPLPAARGAAAAGQAASGGRLWEGPSLPAGGMR